MHETCLRFIPKGFFEWMREVKPIEVTFTEFGASIELKC